MHKFTVILSACSLTTLSITGFPKDYFWLWFSAILACSFNIGSFIMIEFLKKVRIKIGGRYINTVEEE